MLAAYALIKLSIIFFLRRLFVVQKKGPFSWISISLVVVVSIWHVVLMIFFAIAYSTNSRDDKGRASRTFVVTLNGDIGMAGSDSLLDIVIFILPFPKVRSRSPDVFLHSLTVPKVRSRSPDVFLLSLTASVPDLEAAHVHGEKSRNIDHISDWRMVGILQESDVRSVLAESSNSACGASLVRLAVYADILRNRANKAMNENGTSSWFPDDPVLFMEITVCRCAHVRDVLGHDGGWAWTQRSLRTVTLGPAS